MELEAICMMITVIWGLGCKKFMRPTTGFKLLTFFRSADS